MLDFPLGQTVDLCLQSFFSFHLLPGVPFLSIFCPVFFFHFRPLFFFASLDKLWVQVGGEILHPARISAFPPPQSLKSVPRGWGLPGQRLLSYVSGPRACVRVELTPCHAPGVPRVSPITPRIRMFLAARQRWPSSPAGSGLELSSAMALPFLCFLGLSPRFPESISTSTCIKGQHSLSVSDRSWCRLSEC